MTIDNELPEDDPEELARVRRAKVLHMYTFLRSGFDHTLDALYENQDLDRMMFMANLLKYVEMGFLFESQQINDQLDNLNEVNLDDLEF